MQISEQRIAEIIDFSRFEPSKTMKKIVTAFSEKYKLARNNSREKLSFEELSGERAAKTVKQQVQNTPEKISEVKNDKKL